MKKQEEQNCSPGVLENPIGNLQKWCLILETLLKIINDQKTV